MNNYINYYYNIYPEAIHEQSDKYYFNYNNENYYFVTLDRPADDANYLYQLNQQTSFLTFSSLSIPSTIFSSEGVV